MIHLNTVSPSQNNTAQCGWVIGEQLKKDVEGTGCGLIRYIIHAFARRV